MLFREQNENSDAPGLRFIFFGDVYEALKKGNRQFKVDLKEKTKEASDDISGKGDRLLCSACGHPITNVKNKVSRNGSHEHTFANPHGIVFQIGCFAAASGCVADYKEYTDYPWFPGYSWRIELCANCWVHLGWFFRSESDQFHGLVLDKLVQEDLEFDA